MRIKTKKLPLNLCLLLFAFFASCSGNKTKSNEETSMNTIEDSLVLNNPIDLKSLDTLHLCTEMLPPLYNESGFEMKSQNIIYPRNQLKNDTVRNNTIKSFKKSQNVPTQAAGLKDWVWDLNHTNLKVMFLDGDPIVQMKVINTAKEWERYCGIHFNFGNFDNPDITISFRYRGSWSYIGSYCSSQRPSMNLGWLKRTTGQDEYNRVVLHEFGHAIGFIHEHLNPEQNPIQWNKPLVYRYYAGPPNRWDQQTVDVNIFQKYDRSELNMTVFDPLSIMLYSFPAILTTNGYSTNSNSSISETDKQFASDMYPLNN